MPKVSPGLEPSIAMRPGTPGTPPETLGQPGGVVRTFGTRLREKLLDGAPAVAAMTAAAIVLSACGGTSAAESSPTSASSGISPSETVPPTVSKPTAPSSSSTTRRNTGPSPSSNRPSISETGSTPTPSEASTDVPNPAETSQRALKGDAFVKKYRSIPDIKKYYALPADIRYTVTWSILSDIVDRNLYISTLGFLVDEPGDNDLYLQEWNPAGIDRAFEPFEATPTDDGEKIRKHLLFYLALARNMYVVPEADSQTDSNKDHYKIDKRTANQFLAGVLDEPGAPSSLRFLVEKGWEGQGGQAQIADYLPNITLKKIREGKNHAPLKDEHGELYKIIHLQSGKAVWVFNVRYQTFVDKNGDEHALWVVEPLIERIEE